MFLGHPLTPPAACFVARREQERRAAEALATIDPSIDPAAPIGTLKVAQRQIVEIARALLDRAKIVAMDEPTSSLTPSEFERLAEVIAGLARDGVVDHLCLAQDGRGVPASASAPPSCATASSSIVDLKKVSERPSSP